MSRIYMSQSSSATNCSGVGCPQRRPDTNKEEGLTQAQPNDKHKRNLTLAMPRQSIRIAPDARVTTDEGLQILLRCEVDNQKGNVQWIKDTFQYIFHSNRIKANNPDFEHFQMVGNPANGEHSLLIDKPSEKDSGYYECQVQPTADDSTELRAGSNVTVRPLPPLEIHTNTLTSTTNEQALLTRSAPNELGSLTQHQSRAIPVVKATLLPPAFISPHSSISSSSSSSSSSSISNAHPVAASTFGQTSAGFVIGWPFLLLLIAGLLMMANIYLICSLIKRHQRKKDSSLESASSGSAGTGSSRMEATEQADPSPHEFYPSSPSVLVTSGTNSISGCKNSINYDCVGGGGEIIGADGHNGPSFASNASYAAPIMHGAYHLPGSWVLEC